MSYVLLYILALAGRSETHKGQSTWNMGHGGPPSRLFPTRTIELAAKRIQIFWRTTTTRTRLDTESMCPDNDVASFDHVQGKVRKLAQP
jgi:hypothetical protein